MATLVGDCTGRIIYTREELNTWLREHKAALIRSGRVFNEDAYKECCKILKRFKAVGAIIPEDEEADMERLMNRFMLVSQEQGNTTLTNRTLFDGIQILMGDSDSYFQNMYPRHRRQPRRLRTRVLVREAEWRCCPFIWKESSQKRLLKAMKR